MMSNIYLETLNIEWGQIDPKHNRRVKVTGMEITKYAGMSCHGHENIIFVSSVSILE